VLLVTVVSNLAAAVVWLHPGRSRGTRWAATLVILVLTSALTPMVSGLRTSWDVSEDRRNSFSVADERALSQLRTPIRVEVNLAPEDPRLADLDRSVLRKLRRTVPDIAIVNTSTSRSGLFGTSNDGDRAAGYGEVWYQVGEHRAMSRSTVEPIVLDLIYELAGIQAPARDDRAYPGYPLRGAPSTAPWFFYFVFPVMTGLGLWLASRRM